jgi:hypothetical protein
MLEAWAFDSVREERSQWLSIRVSWPTSRGLLLVMNMSCGTMECKPRVTISLDRRLYAMKVLEMPVHMGCNGCTPLKTAFWDPYS